MAVLEVIGRAYLIELQRPALPVGVLAFVWQALQ
jgi:hypothetical protein